MKARIFREINFFLLFISGLIPLAFTFDIPNGFDEIAFSDLQLRAVVIDMQFPLVYTPEDKEALKVGSKYAIKDLEKIERYIKKINVSKELVSSKNKFLEAIESLKEFYKGIEEKTQKQRMKDFKSFRETYDKFIDSIRNVYRKYRELLIIPPDFHQIDQEIKFARNKADADNYIKAVDLIKKKKFEEAYEILFELEKQYKNTPFGDCIMLRMSDCVLLAYYPREDEKGISMLEKIIESKRYSPIIFEAFLKWRTKKQEYNGYSNYSIISNEIYNQKRWELIKLIKKYLKDHPNDLWARKQINLLLFLPNIERLSFGNSNMVYLKSLYFDKQ